MSLNPLILISFGILVGTFSGLMGLGGGAVMIPIMVLLLGITQTKAHGLSLAVMVPPVTLPAVIAYLREGKLQTSDLWIAALIALGFACGSYFGGFLAAKIDNQGKTALQLVFGFLLIYVAGYTVFGKEHLSRTVVMAAALVAVAAIMYGATCWYDAT